MADYLAKQRRAPAEALGQLAWALLASTEFCVEPLTARRRGVRWRTPPTSADPGSIGSRAGTGSAASRRAAGLSASAGLVRAGAGRRRSRRSDEAGALHLARRRHEPARKLGPEAEHAVRRAVPRRSRPRSPASTSANCCRARAKQMHHLALVRSLCTKDNSHSAGVDRIQRGDPKNRGVAYPFFGSAVAKLLGPGDSGLPPYVWVKPGNGGFIHQDAGFLGPKYGALAFGDGKPPENLLRPADAHRGRRPRPQRPAPAGRPALRRGRRHGVRPRPTATSSTWPPSCRSAWTCSTRRPSARATSSATARTTSAGTCCWPGACSRRASPS